jgi:DNA-binding NarL/FixJ family response regulator
MEAEAQLPQKGRTRIMKDGAKRLILADHHLLRRGFKSLLGEEPDLEVVGEASNGLQAVELCRRLQPDLILMDIRMPEMDGITATRKIKAEQPGVGVLMVTMHNNPDYLLEAPDTGAAGNVLKEAPADRLISAVHRTLNGESPLNQELATLLLRRLADEKQHKPEPQADDKPQIEALTPRETEVLALLTTGQTNQQIAHSLNISKGTAKVHVERIIRKLDVSDRTQAAVRAIELGFPAPDLGV